MKCLESIKENKIIIKKNFKFIVIYLLIICGIPLLCEINFINRNFTKGYIPYEITGIIFIIIFIFVFITNFKFIKKAEKKIYNLVFSVFMPIIVMLLSGIIIINMFNSVFKTNIWIFWRAPYVYTDYKYTITYSPRSMIEQSYNYKYYIDLKSKKVVLVKRTFDIGMYAGEDIVQKRIDDSTKNKLKDLLKEIDELDANAFENENQEHSIKSMILDLRDDCYYVSTKTYKDKKIDCSAKRELLNELNRIFQY